MNEIFFQYFPFIIGILTVYFGYKYYVSTFLRVKHVDSRNEFAPSENGEPPVEKEEHISKDTVKSKKLSKVKKKEVKDSYTHPWLLTNLKGHIGEILDMDFSPNGKQLVSCSDDRAVMLWNMKTLTDKNHKSIRVNIEYDHASHIKWSPDSKAFIVSAAVANTVQVYKVSKRSDGQLGNVELILTFPAVHTADIINVGIASNGHFIMTCSSDTTLVVWDLKGNQLASVDTLHMNNYHACVSPCGRFVASSGFTPDVRIWEVCFDRANEFKEVKRAFELKGHSSGIHHFSFSNDSSKMLTTSKDGTCKLWDTNIEYHKGQDPYLLKTIQHGHNSKTISALSLNGRTIAIATVSPSSVYLYSGVNGQLQAELIDIHSDPISSVQFSPDEKYILVSAGKCIRVFHNVPGYQNTISDLEETLKSTKNVSTRERLKGQIESTTSILKTFQKI